MELFELSTIDPAVLPSSSRVVAFRGHEALSSSYAYDILIRVPRDDAKDLDPAALLDQAATLRVRDREGANADVHGVLWSVELLHGDEHVYMRLELSPRVRHLQLARTSRVFTDTTIGDVVKIVLEEAGVTGPALIADPALDAASEEHVCQYEESHWDFIARWLERLGTTFLFDHAGVEEKIVFLSDPGKHPESTLQRLPIDPKAADDASAGRSAFDVRFARSGRVGKIRLRDGDYANPSLDVSGEADADDRGEGEWVHHGRRFFEPGAGGELARVVAEAQLARTRTIEILARSAPVHAGYSFELEGHPDAERNGKVVATRVETVGWNVRWTKELESLFPLSGALGEDASWSAPSASDDGHVSRISAIPAGTAYRAPLVTPWPRVLGVETAVIDGDDADYADLDDQGRYQVRFHFDARAEESGRHSTRVRSGQPHAGNPEGWHLPLRPTTEVLVAFEDGDVDRPVIVGAVPDGKHPSKVTSANATKNVFHTGSDNRLEIEDQAGTEWLHWLTPTETTYIHLGAHEGSDAHNIVKHTDADLLFRIGTNQDVTVGGELREWVSGPVDEDYNTSQLTIVLGPQTTHTSGAVKEDYDALQLTMVASDVKETYKLGHESKVTGTKLELYASGHKTDVTGGVKETYTGPHVKAITSAVTQTYTTGLERKVAGPVLQTWGSDVTLDWGATDATYASLLWVVPANVHYTVPRIDLFQLTKTALSFQWGGFMWVRPDQAGYKPYAWGAGKIEYQARHICQVGAKGDATGFSLSLQAGPNHTYGGVHLELHGLHVMVSGPPAKAT